MKNKLFFLIIVFLILIFALSPENLIDKNFFIYDDKLKHILAFMILSYSIYKLTNIKFKFYILITFAANIEIAQTFVEREGSFFDFLASITGILIYLLIIKIRKLIIQP